MPSRGSPSVARSASGSDRVDRDPFASADKGQTRVRPGSDPGLTRPPADRQLTGEQTDALERLRQLADTRAFRVALLHGVTGSGKTEIYLRLVGRGARRPAAAC